MPSIVFESVEKIFRRGGFLFPAMRAVETRALQGFSLEVFRGEVLALLGPNGSGKTTTLKLVSTMLLPDVGRVLVNGHDTQLDSHSVRTQVGFALAGERSFFPRLTVRENLEFFAALEDVPRRERAERVNSVLRNLDLLGAAEKQAMKLSSGMYQRLGIARALIKRPSVLLLDEPGRSLDPTAAANLCSSIRQIAGSGVTVVMATHNLAEAIAVADRIAILQHGRLLSTCSGALSAEQLRTYYLRVTGESHPDPVAEQVPA